MTAQSTFLKALVNISFIAAGFTSELSLAASISRANLYSDRRYVGSKVSDQIRNDSLPFREDASEAPVPGSSVLSCKIVAQSPEIDWTVINLIVPGYWNNSWRIIAVESGPVKGVFLQGVTPDGYFTTIPAFSVSSVCHHNEYGTFRTSRYPLFHVTSELMSFGVAGQMLNQGWQNVSTGLLNYDVIANAGSFSCNSALPTSSKDGPDTYTTNLQLKDCAVKQMPGLTENIQKFELSPFVSKLVQPDTRIGANVDSSLDLIVSGIGRVLRVEGDDKRVPSWCDSSWDLVGYMDHGTYSGACYAGGTFSVPITNEQAAKYLLDRTGLSDQDEIVADQYGPRLVRKKFWMRFIVHAKPTSIPNGKTSFQIVQTGQQRP